MTRVFCDYCCNEAKLVHGDVIYRTRPDLRAKFFWHCEPCAAWVGCHGRGARIPQADGSRKTSNGTMPLGRLAKADLRTAKRQAHAAFDPLWQSHGLSRLVAYAWLAHQLRIPVVDCHVGAFDVSRCMDVVRLCYDPNRIINDIFRRRAA